MAAVGYNSPVTQQPPKVLTIAGSDSGGAAGLQCDLKSWTVLGVYGMSALTAVTAQNSRQVAAVHFLPADLVKAQIEAVLSDYGAAAAKTGFIGRAELVGAIAAALAAFQPLPLVVDPVLVNHLGQPMFSPSVTEAYQRHLLPLADLVTPNMREAALLADQAVDAVRTEADMATAAEIISGYGPRHVLIKGHRAGDQAVDLLFDGQRVTYFHSPWSDSQNLHGSGDSLSAAVCAFLARGLGMAQAVSQARQYTARAIRGAAGWQMGGGHGPISPWG
jgi:hydroxymethylpyrimidine/phosphomethylpyrimidine kinase